VLKHRIELGRNYYFLPEVSINSSQLFRQRSTESGAQSLDLTYNAAFNTTMRSFVNLGSGVQVSMSDTIGLDGRVNVGYMNTQMFTPNNTNAAFTQAGEVLRADGRPVSGLGTSS